LRRRRRRVAPGSGVARSGAGAPAVMVQSCAVMPARDARAGRAAGYHAARAGALRYCTNAAQPRMPKPCIPERAALIGCAALIGSAVRGLGAVGPGQPGSGSLANRAEAA
jgi:hypothetical protein